MESETTEITSNEQVETKTTVQPVKRKRTRYFESYISKILKSIFSAKTGEISTENGITANAKQQLNSVVCIIANIISSSALKLTIISKKKTLSVKELENATTLILGKLSENAVKQAQESVETFLQDDTKHSSRQDKAGIFFPPSITEKFLRNFGYYQIMVTSTSPVFFASILEYVATVILVSASKLAEERGRVRITIRDLELTVRTYPELCSLFEKCNLSLVGGGVVPNIHDSLLNRKPRKKKKIITDPLGDKKTHRFRPGTVSLREIRKFQKVSDCLTFAKYPFERFVRSIVNNYNDGMKISKDVFTILQYFIEQFIIDFLRDANSSVIHCGRVKLLPSDINFICRLRKYQELDISPYKAIKEENEKIILYNKDGETQNKTGCETQE